MTEQKGFKGTYTIIWEKERAYKNLKFYKDLWGNAELWRLSISPRLYKEWRIKHSSWECFIIKKPDTPKDQCKEAHIMGVITEEDTWERLA